MYQVCVKGSFPPGSLVKNPSAKQETRIQSLVQESPPAEGNGNPLQCSCLENPRDGEACWAAIYGVAQSRTRLKRLSSSSSMVWFYSLNVMFNNKHKVSGLFTVDLVSPPSQLQHTHQLRHLVSPADSGQRWWQGKRKRFLAKVQRLDNTLGRSGHGEDIDTHTFWGRRGGLKWCDH